METTTIDTERQVVIHENTFEVLRYQPDTPMHYRTHEYTVGRFDDANDRLLNMLAHGTPAVIVSAAWLQVESRTEVWETDFEECELCGNKAPTAEEILHTEEACFK